jgi:4-alpha-glucanotransferase
MSVGALGELAAACGVQTSFTAGGGAVVQADPDVVLALLQALGVPITRVADAPEALRSHRAAEARRLLPPVLVLRGERPATFGVTLPAGADPEGAWVSVELEDGSIRHQHLVGADARYQFTLNDPGAETVPAGYHGVRVEAAGVPGQQGKSETALLISAPPCPKAQRGWGVFMPLHALRTEDNWGIGSYRDLAELGEWAGRLGGALVGGLPLYPVFLDAPIDPSPYRPVSRLAYNELYIDPLALPELAQSSAARDRLGSEEFTVSVAAARKAPLVEYEEAARLRRLILEPMAEGLFAGPSARRDELNAFVDAHPELAAYARFQAGRSGGARDEADAATVGGAGAPVGQPGPELGYQLYCQWAAWQQLQAAGDGAPLYADLPIGVHPDGFDPVWSPASFLPDVHGGSPPDLFFAGGQDWNFPPLHPERMRDDGYRYLRAVMARAVRHAAYLRVDHVMGLQRLYMIPAGADARHGAYVSYRADELHALVSLEASRVGCVIVGEDLGTVPEEVHERMADDRMLRSWVFQFESTVETPLPEPPAGVLASLSTHDLPRFAAYLWGADIDEGEQDGRLTRAEADVQRSGRERYRRSLFTACGIDGLPAPQATVMAHHRCLAHLAAGPADLVLVDLEELWGEQQPQNRPGTGTEAGNWRRRGARTLTEAREDAGIGATLRHLDRLRRGVAS